MLVGVLKMLCDFIDEVEMVEDLGLGVVFIFERFDKKEVVMFSGVVGVVFKIMWIIIVVMNYNIRYLMVMVFFVMIMYFFIGGRFMLGIGWGVLFM